MLFERKLTERELDSREAVIQGLLGNKRNLVKKYGKDAEKVMYGIATKKAKSKVEDMNKEKIRELIYKALTNEASVDDVIDPADYGLIGAGYLAGFGRKHSLNLDQLETLGRKIVKQLYKGDFKAAKAKFVKEDNDPSGEYLEGDPGEHVEEGTCGYDRDVKGNKLKGPGGLGEAEDKMDDNRVPGAALILPRGKEVILQAEETDYKRGLLVELTNKGGYKIKYWYGDDVKVYPAEVVVDGESIKKDAKEVDILFHPELKEDLDVGHVDDEPGMLKSELARAGKMIQMLYRAIDKYDGKGEVDFPQWWQKKIIQANSMLDSAFDYLDGKENVAKIDAMIDMNEVSDANLVKGMEVIKKTLSKEGGAAGLDPLVKELVKLGFKKDEVVDLLKKMTSVKKHRDGDYILLPLEEKELSKKDKKELKAIEKELKGAVKAHGGQAKRIAKIVREKLSKRNDVGDFVDDFKKSKAPQFKGKSAEKKRKMAVAAYLAKQNEK